MNEQLLKDSASESESIFHNLEKTLWRDFDFFRLLTFIEYLHFLMLFDNKMKLRLDREKEGLYSEVVYFLKQVAIYFFITFLTDWLLYTDDSFYVLGTPLQQTDS